MYNCDVCNVSLKGRLQFEAHIGSRRHKKTASQASKKRKTTMSSRSTTTVTLRLGLLKPAEDEEVDDDEAGSCNSKASRIQLLSILREVTALPLKNITDAIRLQDTSNENAIELHFPFAPSDLVRPDAPNTDRDIFIKNVKERFSNVQHAKVLAIDIIDSDSIPPS